MKRGTFVLAFAAYLVLGLFDFNVSEKTGARIAANDLVVHEWGTFTTIAGQNGAALDWRPLSGADDLPVFVYTSANRNGWRGSYRDPGKGRLAKVRMETPVIYFYTAEEMEVDVRVSFPGGTITEWYPQAGWVNARFESGINWGKVRLVPSARPDYPRESAPSHYYPARETDAVPIRVCDADKTRVETEKFLFYRGVGDFGLPLTVKIDGRNLILDQNEGGAIKHLIVFENRGGRIGFRIVESLTKETIVERPETGRPTGEVFGELEKILRAEGLYEKEAKAMIETWKDSWFEEGLRVFYVLPAAATDKILPLAVEPAPRETVRVMVARVELITPEMEMNVRRQLGLLEPGSASARREARRQLLDNGRFYEPVLRRLLENEKSAEVRARIGELLSSIKE